MDEIDFVVPGLLFFGCFYRFDSGRTLVEHDWNQAAVGVAHALLERLRESLLLVWQHKLTTDDRFLHWRTQLLKRRRLLAVRQHVDLVGQGTMRGRFNNLA